VQFDTADATGVVVSSGGVEYVGFGGNASDITVHSGGEIIEAFGSTVTGLSLSSGAIVFDALVAAGTSVAGEILISGLQQSLDSGGRITGATVEGSA
jgi:autotransporter passenger strand-loop-strand repeat protein